MPEESTDQVSWRDLNRLEGLASAKLPVPSKGQPEVQHLGMGIPLLVVALGQLKSQCCVSSQEMCTKSRIFCGELLRWVGAPPQLGGEGCWLCLAWRRERDLVVAEGGSSKKQGEQGERE